MPHLLNVLLWIVAVFMICAGVLGILDALGVLSIA